MFKCCYKFCMPSFIKNVHVITLSYCSQLAEDTEDIYYTEKKHKQSKRQYLQQKDCNMNKNKVNKKQKRVKYPIRHHQFLPSNDEIERQYNDTQDELDKQHNDAQHSLLYSELLKIYLKIQNQQRSYSRINQFCDTVKELNFPKPFFDIDYHDYYDSDKTFLQRMLISDKNHLKQEINKINMQLKKIMLILKLKSLNLEDIQSHIIQFCYPQIKDQKINDIETDFIKYTKQYKEFHKCLIIVQEYQNIPIEKLDDENLNNMNYYLYKLLHITNKLYVKIQICIDTNHKCDSCKKIIEKCTCRQFNIDYGYEYESDNQFDDYEYDNEQDHLYFDRRIHSRQRRYF